MTYYINKANVIMMDMRYRAICMLNVPNKRNYSNSMQPAFTIVELLVVIAVIGILAVITIVSYVGITNRATIASIQSDLTNASTILKLDQMTGNDNFPTTLALANGGKGIASSQIMDSIIYVPDNTSNPKNFCLQYRKGANTYAVDSISQPTTGVCLQNLVTNGDFSQGSTGWSVHNIPGGVFANNEFVGTATVSGAKITDSGIPFTSGHKYYMRAYIKADSTAVFVFSYDGVNSFYAYNNGSGNYALTSGVFTSGNTTSNTGQFQMVREGRSSGWTEIRAKQGMLVDLTASFGAGNEPTKTQMDTIMNSYSNNWFDIVAKANL